MSKEISLDTGQKLELNWGDTLFPIIELDSSIFDGEETSQQKVPNLDLPPFEDLELHAKIAVTRSLALYLRW